MADQYVKHTVNYEIKKTPAREKIISEALTLLEDRADSKGYITQDRNPLMDFMNQEFPDHALGEIIYKVKRYKAKKNPEDLAKIIAWAILIYEWRTKP